MTQDLLSQHLTNPLVTTLDATVQPKSESSPFPSPSNPLLTLSVVIASYNNLGSLIPCVSSLIATGREAGKSGRLEILVQDDASPDFNINDVLFDPVSAVRNPVNLGFSGNNNACAMRSHGDILLFLNQDTRALEGWFEPMMRLFDDPKVGIVGPKLVFENLTAGADDSIQSAGGLFDVNRNPYHRYLGYAADHWLVNQTEKVSWVTGAALAIRRELFFKAGGFDVGYKKGYWEDVELNMCVKEMGYEVWYAHEACFTHKVGSTGGVPAEIFRANMMRFKNKWASRITPDVNIGMVNF